MPIEAIFIPGVMAPTDSGRGYWFLFQGYKLLVDQRNGITAVPRLDSPQELGLSPSATHYLGTLEVDGETVNCFCGEIEEGVVAPEGHVYQNLRPLYATLDEQLFWLAGRAVQIVDWDRTNRYCGRCGQPMGRSDRDRSKVCPNCGLTIFPRLAPAVIVRVQRQTARGPEILLARANRFPTAMYSVLAGFVEPGETLEECVYREIQEEVGIRVGNIRYFGSQPWPFPHSLMIAFTADYDNGELTIDPLELADARWFAPDELPDVAPPPSIANSLITDWLAETAEA